MSKNLLKSLFRRADKAPAAKGLVPSAITKPDGKIIGVRVPIINKAFYFCDVPEGDREMNWPDAMDYAKKRGRTLPTKREFYVILFFKNEINAIAAEAGHPDFLSGWAWSSTEHSTNNAWGVGFPSGSVYYDTKYSTDTVVRPVADI